MIFNPNIATPLQETEFRIAKHLRKVLHLNCENNMRCLNPECDGHYKPICDECEYTGWISVKDRLPNVGDRVLFLSEGEIDFAYYFKEEGWKLMDGGDWHTIHSLITHWMPLPQPPRNENGMDR